MRENCNPSSYPLWFFLSVLPSLVLQEAIYPHPYPFRWLTCISRNWGSQWLDIERHSHGVGGPVASGFFQQLVCGRGFPSSGLPVTSHSGVSGAHPHSASFMSSWVFVFSFSVRPQERVNHMTCANYHNIPECLFRF